MIFKHLFTPKWKHPKQQVRLDAIEKLDVARDVTILSTLALEDSSAEIRRKALQKVNDLPLWWKAYKQDQALKDVAEQQISSAVLNSESSLSAQIKNEYIERFAPVKTLEKLAFAEKELQVRVKLLKRLANPKLIEKAFKEVSSQVAGNPFTAQDAIVNFGVGRNLFQDYNTTKSSAIIGKAAISIGFRF